MAAQVFLFSKSGRPVRELAGASLDELPQFQPSDEARVAVLKSFELMGFRAFTDSTGLAITIEGPVALFSKTFGTTESLASPSAMLKSGQLKVPEHLAEYVAEIHALPPPDLHV